MKHVKEVTSAEYGETTPQHKLLTLRHAATYPTMLLVPFDYPKQDPTFPVSLQETPLHKRDPSTPPSAPVCYTPLFRLDPHRAFIRKPSQTNSGT